MKNSKLRILLLLSIFICISSAQISIQKGDRQWSISIRSDSVHMVFESQNGQKVFSIIADSYVDYWLDSQVSIPFRHFALLVHEKIRKENIRVNIKSLKYIEIPDSISNILPDDMVRLTGFDEVFGLTTLELDVFPITKTSNGRIAVITEFEIVLNFKSRIPESLSSSVRIKPSSMKLLEARVSNANFYHYRYDPALAKPAQVNYDFSTGSWFKMKYSKESFYKISLNELRNNGLTANEIPFDDVQCYGYQGEDLPLQTQNYPEGLLQIPVIPGDADNDGVWDENEYIYFYARPGNHFEFNSQTQKFEFKEYYFDDDFYVILHIGTGDPKTAPSSPAYNPTGTEIITTTNYYHHLERSINNILSSGLEWYDVRFSGLQDQKTISFDLPAELDIMTDSTAEATLRFKGGNGSFYSENTNVWHYFDATLNVTPVVSNVSVRANGAVSSTAQIPANSIQNQNSLKIDYRSTRSFAYAYFDYLELQFKVRIKDYPFFLTIISPQREGIHSFGIQTNTLVPSDFLVCDITDPWNYKVIPLQINDNQLIFTDSLNNSVRWYGLMKKEDIPSPDEVEPIMPHSNLRDPAFNADVLLISPPDLLDQAQQIKSIYESRPIKPYRVFIARTDQIYLEFSSGSVHPLAFRNYIRYLAYNATAPTHVVLLGNGHFDYKNILYSSPNYIPPFEKEHPFEINSKPLDILLTDLNRFDNSLTSILPDISIGRIPVSSPTDAQNYVDKLAKYEAISPENIIQNNWRSRILLVADDEVSTFDKSEYYHLGFSEELISGNRIPSYFDILKLYLYDYPLAPGGLGRAKPQATQDLISYINSGVQLINYYGHGSPTTWAHESVFTIDRDGEKIQNPYKNPIIVAGTCDFGTFDQPNHPSASVQLLNMEQRGAIAVLSASRPSYASGNRSLTYSFFSNFYRKDFPKGTNTIGEAFIKAVMATGGFDNSQSYNVLGMPVLQPIIDAYYIQVDSLSEDTLKALSTVHFKASVRDSSNLVINQFNGKCYLLVRDAASDPKTSGPYTYRHAGPFIFKGVYTISNGIVEGDFIIPKSIQYKNDPSGKIFLYAISEDFESAIGLKDSLLITGSEQGIQDNKGPEVKIQFQENPSFVNGDILPPNATMQIEVFDEHGINTTNEVGHEILLVIDGEQKFNLTEFFIYKENSYQEGVIEYPLPPLEVGRHTMVLRIWDNLNNPTESEFSFEVVSPAEEGEALSLYHVVNYPNPMTEDTYFTFSVYNTEPSASVKIKIFTLTGRLIKTIESLLPNPQGFQKIYWDGTDEDGERLANGVYLYKVIVDNGVKKVSKTEKLMIMK